MTRKKSNVKALALAVTCAILAGGYSGLNPVYAAAPVYHDVVKYDSANQTLDYEYNAGGGIGTAAIQKIKFGNVVLDSSDSASPIITVGSGTRLTDGKIIAKNGLYVGSSTANDGTGSYFSVGGSDGSINAANGKFNVSGAGAITATSLSLGTMNDVAATINSKAAQTDVDANKTNIATNQTRIQSLDGKIDTVNTNIRRDMANEVSTINTKIDTKLDTSTFGAYTTSNDAAVNDLKNKTQNIKVAKDTIVTSSDATYIDGITHAGGVRLADNGVRAKELVLEEEFADHTSAQATLTREGLAALNSMVYDEHDKINIVDGKPVIQAGNGSVVGGVKFDNKNITNVDSVMVNKDATNQVQINSEGIVVGLHSTVIGSDGVYAGGHTDATAKAVLGADGSIKGAGDGTVKYKFTVDGATGNVVSKGSVTANQAGFNDLAVTNGLTVGSATGDFVNMQNGNVVATGSVTAKGGLSAANGKFSVDGTTGDTTVKGKLDVTGDATFGGDLTVAKKIKGQSLNIGATGSEFTVDTVGNVKANGITTSDTTTNKIGGVTLAGSDINAKNLTLTGTLTAAKYNAIDIEATNSIKVGATTMTNGKLDLGSNGTVDFGANELNDAQVGNINNVIQSGGIVKAADGSVIGGVSFSAKDITGVKDLTATGKVTADTITDGTASLSGGALTGLASVNIGGNTTIDNTGIKTNKLIVGSGLNATTIDEANGVVSAKGEIGAVKFSGSGKLDNVTAIDGVSVAQNSGSAAGGLTFGGNAIIGATGIPFQSTGFKVDDDGDVEGKTFTTAADGTGNRSTLASGQLTIDPKNTWTKDNGIIASNVKVGTNELKDDGLHVGTNTLVKDGEITVGAGNSWSMANGIAATKAAINGVTIGETAGKAVFNKAGKSTIIDGDTIETGKITADELLIDKISLGKGGSSNITIDKDGHVQTKGDITITDAAGNVMSKLSQDQATFGKDADNQTNINNGKLNAKAKNTANQQAEFNFDENGLTVSGQNAAGQKSSFGFDTSTGIGTFTGQDNTTTAINGSSITSTNGAAAGVLNGSNLTLTNGANSTALTAGGATFTGADGRSDATGVKNKTIIDGGIITTDTLNVQRIELGDKLVDGNGTPLGGNLSMDEYGNIKAAGGKFTVAGTNQTNPGALHNEVGGKTFLDTTETGASMKFDNTAATDGVKSEVSVEANKATVAAGDKASFVANTDNGGTATITGGTQTVTTTGAGTVFNNSAHNTPFGGGIVTETTINGNEITTGKITTDQLVIKGNGSGNADGTGSTPGSIALGGNGSITSNIIAGTQEATFKTDETGTFTEAKDGANKTTNTVNAQGNTNEVTDGTNTSTATQTATAIGGVITNGTVKLAEAELNKDGFTVKQKDKTDVKIADGDVTVTNNRNTTDPQYANQTVHLSDLGSLNNLEGELTARDEYQNNKTAVGGINAEAAIRREEVARLDNRIDDVNNRVDKVGAMAAAIASLKSIGYDPQAPSEFSIGLGQYKGETGVAMGFFHYPNKNFMINVSLSTAGGETMGGIGATWRFGHKSPQKLLDEQREAQAKKELAAAEKYQAAAKLAKEAQERAEYAAKLARQAQVSADNAKAAADATQAKHFQ